MRRVITAITVVMCAASNAAPICQWEVTALDGKSREVRTFRPGSTPIELALPRLKGFNSCRISPVKQYQFDGVQATRIDFWCFTSSGDAVNIGSVASTKFGTDITTFQMLAGPVSINSTSDGDTTVNSSGFIEISAVCK